MRIFLFIFLVGLSVAGCTTLTAPDPDSPNTFSLTAYFWPSQDTVLSYQTDSGNHSISLNSTGTTATDLGPSSPEAASLTIQKSGSTISLGGLTAADIFGIDPEIQIVGQTTPITSSQSISIQSIASVGPNLYLASSTKLYRNLPGQQPQDLGPLPAPGVQLRAGLDGEMLYAVEFGGDRVFFATVKSNPSTINWSTVVGNGGSITAFAPLDDRSGGSGQNIFLTATGGQLYQGTDDHGNATASPFGPMLSGTVTAIEWEQGFGPPTALAGMQDGRLFQVGAGRKPIDSVTVINFGSRITAISQGFVGTQQGLYAFDGFSLWGQINTNPVLTLLNAGSNAVFASLSTGQVIGVSNRGLNIVPFGYPNGTSGATAFGVTLTQSGGSRVATLFALAGASLFQHDANVPSTAWTPINSVTTGSTQWPAGTFTILANGASSWQVGYALRTDLGTSRVYTYNASVTGQHAMVLDNVGYSDVIIVTYLASLAGVADTTVMPKFVIYFQKGLGPIRIERTENLWTEIVRLVK